MGNPVGLPLGRIFESGRRGNERTKHGFEHDFLEAWERCAHKVGMRFALTVGFIKKVHSCVLVVVREGLCFLSCELFDFALDILFDGVGNFFGQLVLHLVMHFFDVSVGGFFFLQFSTRTTK